ncbi:L-seryl-tRNA(Sec) kinase isoform X2 [Nannospalax galili]|uniref:L-seryl-tRNA(Sec) kinase isoform X2 n=1 Tax=Nannospalax galili TaxID=1026970 RepID=UPI00111C0135|nr:L-seryl-tRNA(Sec) kinase isoform X2 [Nannospalax galili]
MRAARPSFPDHGPMKAAASAEVAGREQPRKLGLCVLCGLPAAGKSTFARALGRQLRRERGWTVGVLSYDDVLPDVLRDRVDARQPGSTGQVGARPTVTRPPRGRGVLRGLLPPQWKMLREELLQYLECFLAAAVNGSQISAPPNRTETMWEDFITCLKNQDLIFSAALEAQSCHLLTETAVSGPLFLVLDDNFYYQSMRYEVYQLARKYCPLETCLQRNGQRPQPLPSRTIHLMERKIEKPNPEKNAWEHNSLIIQNPAYPLEASLEVTGLLLTALENPIKYIEDNKEQKETDRIICSTNLLHKADETLRRTISQTMKQAKDAQIPLSSLKCLAKELNKLKAEFLEDLRQGNKRHLKQTTLSDVISSFCNEKDSTVLKYLSKQH